MSALAALIPILIAPQFETAPSASWRHELVIQDDYEDFFAVARSSGARALLDLAAPLRLATASEIMWTDLQMPREWRGTSAFESAPIEIAAGFEQVLLSWNVVVPPDAGFCVELRVAVAEGDWSPWLYVGDWGVAPPASYRSELVQDTFGDAWKFEPSTDKVTRFDGGHIEVDYFTSTRTWTRAQYRIRASAEQDAELELQVRRVALCFSSRAASRVREESQPSECELPVPFRSQQLESADIRSRLCSPTSVAMVLAYRGVDVPTSEVAARLYDKEHDIYGNWTRAIQGAYSLGVPGYLARFGAWREVEELVRAGQPLVISIAVKKGELDWAPYSETTGHLLVLRGFDERGDVLVNDPAGPDAEHGVTSYRRDQLERAWMERGGTAYVLLPRGR